MSMDEESGSYFSSLLFSLFLPKISRPANTGHANWVGAASLNETVCAVNRVNEWESRDVSSQLLWL